MALENQQAVIPAPAPADAPQLFYRRGHRWPRAIAWFGFKSFWGHLWHLAASAIATEDIDCRDWMHPDSSDVLLRRIARTLGVDTEKTANAGSLAEALEGDVWVDFIADTGDDISVSEAVARLVAGRYEVRDPDDTSRTLTLPRGHVLLFGGDTAYPVATDIEIHNRVVVPFNTVLRDVDDDVPRVLLGVPGNHDWFAGLDGFGRMFRMRSSRLDLKRQQEAQRELEASTDDLEVDRLGQIGHFIEWVEAFRVGRFVVKRSALALVGYTPVQSASYWAFPIAPGIDFWGIDRQLRLVDFHQRGFFAEQRERDHGLVVCLADPVQAFLEPNPAGVRALASLDLSVENDGLMVLTGDTHHYCRETLGKGTHVIAGGGGAFLHPQRIARIGVKPPEAEFPGPKTSLVLALQVPWQIAHGRSGFLVHTAIAIACAPLFGVQWSTGTSAPLTSIVTALVATAVCIFLGGFRSNLLKVGLLSSVAGAAIGFAPLAVFDVVRHGSVILGVQASPFVVAFSAWVLSIYVGTLAIGTYLMLLTILGIEQHQAFSALGHPGYKHFVRLRFRRDGSRVDGWVLGQVDPLAENEPIVLVDTFSWRPLQARREA